MATADSVKSKIAERAGEVALAGESPTIRDMLENPKMQAELRKALPEVMPPLRFARLVMTAVREQPLLLEADPLSLLASCLQCAQLGLEPGTKLGHAWLLPFRNNNKGIVEVNFILGYKGIINLAHRSEHIMSIEARTVYENDDFDYQYGIDERLHHKPVLNEPGESIAWYALARFKSGGHYWVVISPETVEAHRQRSASPNSPAWKNDYDQMGAKTAVRVAAPYLPLSAVAAEGIAADETAPQWEDFVKGNEDVIDVDASDDVDRCAECGEVEGEHRDDCSMKKA